MDFENYFTLGDERTHGPEHIRIIGDVTRGLKVSTLWEWIEINFPEADADSSDPDIFEDPRVKMADDIISLQVCFYMLRRTPYLCQSVGDHVLAMIQRSEEEYKKQFGVEFPDPNKGVQW